MKNLVASMCIMVGITMLGCKDNPKASAACKTANADSEVCNKCCHSNGANGHKYINGDCSCLGGN